MRRAFFLCLGLLELAVAGVLLAIGLLLPGPTAVRQTFGQAERVTASAQKQVTLLGDELKTVDGRRVQRLVQEIEPTLPRTLSSLAGGMEAWAGALDPELVTQLHDGVTRLANFLDQSVAPAAGRSAERLEKATETLRKNALALKELLKAGPPDLKAAREVYDSLGRFNEGLDRVTLLMDGDRLKAMKEGFKGMEGSLTTGADQVAKLASYTYPMVTFKGLKPMVDEKPFWPQGDQVAEGMRKGAKALKAAGKELETQAANLPKLQKALEESRQAVGRTRTALGKALKDQQKLEAVLLEVPKNSARLAEELPAMTADLVKVLREAEKLKEVATALRGKQQNIEKAAKTWPGLRKGLLESAGRIRELQTRLDRLLESPLTQTRLARLDEQRQGLAELGTNLKDVQESLPEMANAAANVTLLLRCLLWLFASLTVFHACYQLTRGRRPRPALGV